MNFMRPQDWLDHKTRVRDCFAHLGDIRGKRALDYGCGHGPASTQLSRRGVRVAAFDMAAGRVRAARDPVEASGEARDPQERPLRHEDLEALERVLPLTRVREPQLLSMVRRVVRNPRVLRTLEGADAWLLARFPILRRWRRYVVVALRKARIYL